MICHRCLRASRGLRLFHTSPLSHATPISTNKATTQTPQPSPPSATSTSAAQPFSTPSTLSPSTLAKLDAQTVGKAEKRNQTRPSSSITEGTPLRGLNYFKNKEDPVALADDEYPPWLWDVLAEKERAVGAKEGLDPRLFSKSAKSRRMANKRARKMEMEKDGMEDMNVPVYEQSVDLPTGPVEGMVAREELTKAMREKRRSVIKEANFLKGMR